ncbi:rRNA maturation RNase YbeY [Ornithinibacillus gellani]|uniref:rRNA maturation RNase YbeY n=1 Tax=Ornithinibacillus gellani TaxID=2293253 RepID=UPI000F4624D2|nr:rRNA maturation RNase YbeY [Ornithinibacillus gellani]TQS74575.1 rRNA maturation RNase YbeY [Ornithinibacillus gellani]
MHIYFHDRTASVSSDIITMLQDLLRFAATKESVTNEAELSVNFVDDAEIQELNRNYRQQNRPTDVISFAMQEPVEGELPIVGDHLPLVLGDIVISIDRAKAQAGEYEHSLEREIGFLAVHGFLHLLGYDHLNEADEKKMFGRQDELLEEFGLER